MNSVRASFEAWANSYWAQGLEENFRDDETGAYVYSAVQDAWQAYKAAHEHCRSACPYGCTAALWGGLMNETLKIEQAYYGAMGLMTFYKDFPEGGHDCLVDIRGNEIGGILHNAATCSTIMQRQEINVEWRDDGVYAWYSGSNGYLKMLFGSEQWKSKLWVLNAAIVMAATQKLLGSVGQAKRGTDKLERAKLELP